LRRRSSANRLGFTLRRTPCAGGNPVDAECPQLSQSAQARVASANIRVRLPAVSLWASGVRFGPAARQQRVRGSPDAKLTHCATHPRGLPRLGDSCLPARIFTRDGAARRVSTLEPCVRRDRMGDVRRNASVCNPDLYLAATLGRLHGAPAKKL
jgi:hypothetical protein